VGYTGGTTADPTYRRMGDHTEAFQVDFDPAVISYDKLLDVFWSDHDPAGSQGSTQYAHVAFWRDEEQRAAIAGSRRAVEDRLGPDKSVTTQVVPLERFYLAEDYHQKYRLRNTVPLAREFGAMFGSDEAALRNSTAAARVNGFIDGRDADSADLATEIGTYGLSPEGQGELLRRAGTPATGASCAF
jgi:peptide-methionine (S)-S-oxide reductase